MDTFLLIGGGALLLYLFTKGSALGNLVFQVQGADFNINNPLSPKILLTVLVSNPTSGSLTLQSLAGYFYINGTQSGTVTYFQLTEIYPNAQQLITLTLSVSEVALVSQIVSYVTGGGGEVDVKVQATANVSNVAVPFSLTFTPVAA